MTLPTSYARPPYEPLRAKVSSDTVDATLSMRRYDLDENGETNRTTRLDLATNAAARAHVAFPKDLADEVGQVDKDRYVALFRIATKKVTDGWRNEVEFTPEAETALRKALDDALRTFDLSRITLEDTNWVVPNPVKGLYYALERTEDLAAGFGVHRYEEATSVSVTFTVNETANTAGRAFYRLLISACPPEGGSWGCGIWNGEC